MQLRDLVLCVVSCVMACEGDTVTLGAKEPPPFRFTNVNVLDALDATAENDNPTLTGDLLEMVFTSDATVGSQVGNQDLWHTSRPSIFAPFAPPDHIGELSTEGFETSPALSLDGLTLWFASDRPGGQGLLDIWVSTRPSRQSKWSPPMVLPGLNSPGRDLPRSLGLHETVMPMASDRVTPDVYWTYLVNPYRYESPELITALSAPDRLVVDGHLTQDGLALLFNAAALNTPGDLFVAQRRTIGRPFIDDQPIDTLNTAADERDPWLSPDGTVLFYVSDAGGKRNIYTAIREP